MILVVLLTMAFAGIAALEAPRLVREKMWGELAAFDAILAIAMALSYPQVLGIPLPNPTDFLQALFEPLEKRIFIQ